jgi:hypothetical protein
LIKICMWMATLTGGDGGDGTGDGCETHRDRTTSRHVAAKTIYIVKNFHFNSGDVRYTGSVGDRNTSNNMAKDVLYVLKNFHFNSGDVRYAHSVDTHLYLAGCASGWGWRRWCRAGW